MRAFDLSSAEYFCERSSPMVLPEPRSLRAYYLTHNALLDMEEGSSEFEFHRLCALVEVEQDLFFAASNYFRAFDLFDPAAAPWSQVTLYYASFFAARALLGMFGVWLDTPNLAVEVKRKNKGAQALRFIVKKKLINMAGTAGSHKGFWALFYNTMASVGPWAPSHLKIALLPVNGAIDWQIRMRNAVNYTPAVAADCSAEFLASVTEAQLRATLRGTLATQLEIAEAMVLLAHHFASEFRLQRTALSRLGSGDRLGLTRALVKERVPARLGIHSKIDLIVP